MPKHILLLATGGTFDKVYDPISGTLKFDQAHGAQILAVGRCRLPVRAQVLMLKDSLDLDDADRQQVLDAVLAAKEAGVVITHGTDTMVQTAQFLAAAGVALAGKTVVLTGAMVPHAIENSDATFNLGVALAFAQSLPPGVHVAMNGQSFAWDRVLKNRACGWFEGK